MYEIWLMLNIVWEILVGAWPLVLALLVLIIVAFVAALSRRGGDWRGALPIALGIAVLAGALVFATLPTLTRSSLHELKYWVDWLMRAGLAAAAAAVVAALTWPLSVLMKPRTPR